jgi:hypothetical protein
MLHNPALAHLTVVDPLGPAFGQGTLDHDTQDKHTAGRAAIVNSRRIGSREPTNTS